MDIIFNWYMSIIKKNTWNKKRVAKTTRLIE
jgi:hypothetical protein